MYIIKINMWRTTIVAPQLLLLLRCGGPSKLDKWYRNYYFQKEAKRQGKRTVFALKAIKIIIVMRSKPH